MLEENIYQKLAKVRKRVEVIQKNKKSFTGKYVTDDAILARITGLMDKLHLSLVPEIVPASTTVTPHFYTKTRATKNGDVYEENVNEILVQCDMAWTWVNNDNPQERIRVPWTMVGQQGDASQAFGSGLTYSMRYFLLKYFNAATPEDDPDNWRGIQQKAEQDADKAVAEEIIAQVHTIVTDIIKKNPDHRDRILEITKRHAKKADGKPCTNYYTITTSNVAGALLADINEFQKSLVSETKKKTNKGENK